MSKDNKIILIYGCFCLCVLGIYYFSCNRKPEVMIHTLEHKEKKDNKKEKK